MERQLSVRRLTISYFCAGAPTKKPYLRLKGKWLAQAGFKVGNQVKVEVEPDRLVITPLPQDLQAVGTRIRALQAQIAVLREGEVKYG